MGGDLLKFCGDRERKEEQILRDEEDKEGEEKKYIADIYTIIMHRHTE